MYVCIYLWREGVCWCVYTYIMHVNTHIGTHTQVYPAIPDLSPRCCIKTLTYKSSYLQIQTKALKAGGWYCMLTLLLCIYIPSPLQLQIH